MYKGGISDKFGNRYEAKWLVRQLLDVIGNKSQSLIFEGIPPEFRGFEFCVEKIDCTEWHQTKINSPNGNWTINALAKEGLLDAFKIKLTTSEKNICVFVSQDPAKDIRSLAEKTQIARSSTEFEETLGKEHTINLNLLNSLWSTTTSKSFEWLKRCKFLTIPDMEIESEINAYSDFYFLNSALSFSVLRDYLESKVNTIISTEKIKNDPEIVNKLVIKSWVLPKTISEKLNEETDAYLGTYVPFVSSGEMISREESSEIINYIQDKNGPTLILLTGVAGSGKSGVIKEVIKHLKINEILHVAIRIDQKLDCSSTTKELGNSIINQQESPVVTLKGISQEKISVLIIDQVDAVSEISGRNGNIKQTILRLINEAHILSTIKIIVSCRTFDLENDSQLKALKESSNVLNINVKLLDWHTSVRPLLISKNISTERISAHQKNILCLPLNLSIFLEVHEGGNPSFSSRNDLFEKLIVRKERNLRAYPVFNWNLMAPLSKIAEWMSEHQKLSAPEGILNNYSAACDLLSSESLIVRSRHSVNFFHESFFDYIYARMFIEKNSSLEELLISHEQHLFRRTQVRQILESLRQANFTRYLVELSSIFYNNNIRYHIKVAIAQWIGSLDDLEHAEIDIILKLDNNERPFPLLIRHSIFNSQKLFEKLLEIDWVWKNINSPVFERQETVLWWLRKMTEYHPDKISDILDRWWGIDDNRGKRLLDWLGIIQTPNTNLMVLCCRVIKSFPDELFNSSTHKARNMLLRSWSKTSEKSELSILQAYFDAWFLAYPDQHPFTNEYIRELDTQTMMEIAEKDPNIFLSGSIDALNRTIDIINKKNIVEVNDTTFLFRVKSEGQHSGDLFLNAFRTALQRIASEDHKTVIEILRKLDPIKHEVFTHLWLETIKIDGKNLSFLFAEILDNPKLFFAGYDGAPWISFANAMKECAFYLDNTLLENIEAKINHYDFFIKQAIKMAMHIKLNGENDQWNTKKNAIQRLNFSGFTKWEIFETIGKNNLSKSTQKILDELRRKFPNERISQPRKYKAHFVGSPIKAHQASLMSDAQWLQAISRYKSDDERQGRDFSGGARQLSNELQQLTKEYPNRFSQLLFSIPNEANKTYISQILTGLSQSNDVDESILYNVIVNAHNRPNHPYGSEIANILEKRPELAQDLTIFDILIWYFENCASEDSDSAQNGVEKISEAAVNIDDEKIDVATINDLLRHFSTKYFHLEINKQFMIAEALGKILFHADKYRETKEWQKIICRAWDIVDNKIINKKSLQTRCILIKPLTPLFNQDKKKCANFLYRLTKDLAFDKNPKNDIFEKLWIRLSFPKNKNKIFNKFSIINSELITFAFGKKYSSESLFPILSDEGTYLFSYIVRQTPEIGLTILYRLVHNLNDVAQKIGIWHILSMSFNDSQYIGLADIFIGKSIINRRLAASIASYSATEGEYKYRAVEVLKKSFNDEDKEVRHQASFIFRNIEPDEFLRFKSLAFEYISSTSIEDDNNSLLYAIRNAKCKVDDLAIAFTEKLISLIESNNEFLHKKTTDFYSLMDIIKYEYRNSESDANLRKRLLDVLDKMLELEVFHVDEILKDYEY